MRDRERRLRRVATRLTGRQRLAALLAENPEDPAPDDDLLRGLTPATWTELRRDAERVDRLRDATREGLAHVESEITLLWVIAERHSTTAQLALLWGGLEYRIEDWSPRRGRGAAADRALGREVREAVRVLRHEIDATRGGGGAGPPLPEALLRAGILHGHHLLRALAIEAAAFTAELDADPLPPELRAQADRCRTDLAALLEAISGAPMIILRPPIELTEPPEEYVAAIAARCRPEEGDDDAAW